VCVQRKRSDLATAAAASDDDNDDDDDDDARGYDVTEKGRSSLPDRVTCGKRAQQTERDDDRRSHGADVTSLDDFRFRCSATARPVTNGTIAQHYCR